MDKPNAQRPDTDPLAHLTATERFAQAVERRDALTRDRRTSVQPGRDTPLAGSTSVTARLKKHWRALYGDASLER